MEFLSLVEDLVPQLIEFGFDPRMCKASLVKHDGDIFKATEELLANDGVVSGDLSQYDIRQESVETIRKNSKLKEEKKLEAFERLKDDISVEDDDHLDITLEQEEMFLIQYLSLLGKK